MIPPLRPGDVLLYSSTGIYARLIKIKTWSHFSHCEVYDGDGHAVASRDSLGVARYRFRQNDLAAVLRPLAEYDHRAAREWFYAVANGQGYDWIGLLSFTSAKLQGRSNGLMFCSEFATMQQRAGKIEPFAPHVDADAVSPGMFYTSLAYAFMYRAPFLLRKGMP